MRQCPLPCDQGKAIDDIFEGHRKAGFVRECIASPHPTISVKKATGGWRINHAFDELNNATIPPQTPISDEDIALKSMSGSATYSAIDLCDGCCRMLMKLSGISLTAIRTPSGLLQRMIGNTIGTEERSGHIYMHGVANAATTLRIYAELLRQFFRHSRAKDDPSEVNVHSGKDNQVSQVMRGSELNANLKKYIFCAPEIPVLGCFVSKGGSTDHENISSIFSWPTPTNPTELRQWLGSANYLHKYSRCIAGSIQRLSSLLKKDATWSWHPVNQVAFEFMKKSLALALVSMLPDESEPASCQLRCQRFLDWLRTNAIRRPGVCRPLQ